VKVRNGLLGLLLLVTSVALAGGDRYVLTKSRMPLVYHTAKTFMRKTDKKVVIGLPLTFETLSAVDALREYIPNLTVIPQSSGENSSTQRDVFPYLEKWRVKHFTTTSEENRIAALTPKQDIVVDCSYIIGETGAKNGLLNDSILIEDTKTGENRLNELSTRYPLPKSYVILDNSPYKRLYENSLGIGYSVIGAMMSMGFYLPNYKVGVVGYGYVGRGVADLARKLGAKDVVVVETNKIRKKAAKESGFKTADLADMLSQVDIVITATGMTDVIKRSDIVGLRKRLILANAGGEEEWNRDTMFAGLTGEKIHEHIERFQVGECDLWEAGGANSINLVREISVSEFLDITFAQLIYVISQVERTGLPTGKTPIDAFDALSFRQLVEELYGPPAPDFKTPVLHKSSL